MIALFALLSAPAEAGDLRGALASLGATVSAPADAPLDPAHDGVRFTFADAFGTLWIAPDDAAAAAVYEGASRTLATRWPDPARALPGDEARGDGVSVVLVRAGHAIVYVRLTDPTNPAVATPAADRASAVIAKLGT